MKIYIDKVKEKNSEHLSSVGNMAGKEIVAVAKMDEKILTDLSLLVITG